MSFKVGDKVRLARMEDEILSYKKYLGQEFKIKEIFNGMNPHCTLKGNAEIAPYLKNLELIKDYTYEDLKKSPIGTKVTFENGEILIKNMENDYESYSYSRNDIDLKGLKDEWGSLGKIIKIEEPEYKTVYEAKEEILDEAEKRYLRGVIRPFRDKVEKIEKVSNEDKDREYFIKIHLKAETPINLPWFPGDMYKGMEDNQKYTLEELGL